MDVRHTVWVVDDDSSVATLAARLLEASGEFACRIFTSPRTLLSALGPGATECVVSDVRMPDIDGAQLQRQLREVDPTTSILFLTGHADVPTTVQLMEQGAVTLLEKPYQPEKLVSAVRKAVSRCEQLRHAHEEVLDTQARLQQLSPDEREVLDCMVAGLTNKAIAHKLALSSRTLDRRRQNILQTMGVESVVELAALLERVRSRQG
ncbi:MAG: response regulator transcription factor [Aureliella sp.]